MADGNSDDQGNRRNRQPKNLEGLLKFCVENTQSEDAPAAGNFRELSPERKEWLSKALDGMVNDPVEEIKKYIRIVGLYIGSQNPSDEDRENALTCLEGLCDWCESYDMANDFKNVGGFSILHELITHSEAEIRALAFKLIATLVQNNPVCQEAIAVTDEYLPTMLTVLSTEKDSSVQIQAVHCISCLVRDGSSETQSLFEQKNGFEILRKVLLTPGPFKRVVKIAFFLQSLCRLKPGFKDKIYQTGIAELLAREVQGEHEQTHEVVMGALLCLTTDHPETQQRLARPDLGMVQFLQQRIQLLTGKEENEEEKQDAQQLLQLVQSSGGS